MRCLLLVAALSGAAVSTPAEAQPSRAGVHVIATGGTIASRGAGGPLTVDQLVDAVPGLDEVASITVEQFTNVGSSQITPDHWLDLARRISAVFAERPDLTGVVVTHGTDTLEETALFLHLTVADSRPVVVTGAMRPATAVAPEGAANLRAAVRVATDHAARDRGVLVVLNDEVFSAADVAKTHTSRLDAFAGPAGGPVGSVEAGAIVFHSPPASPPVHFDLTGVEALPRVDIAYAWSGADGVAVDGFVDAGARGLVMAAVGQGNLPAPLREAARRAASGGVIVVVGSRTGAGRVPVGPDVASDDLPLLPGTGGLNPQRARVVLMLALTRSGTAGEVARFLAAF